MYKILIYPGPVQRTPSEKDRETDLYARLICVEINHALYGSCADRAEGVT